MPFDELVLMGDCPPACCAIRHSATTAVQLEDFCTSVLMGIEGGGEDRENEGGKVGRWTSKRKGINQPFTIT